MVEKVDYLIMKSILEYRNHPSILALEGKLKSSSAFAFFHINLKEILKELGNLVDDDDDDESFLRKGWPTKDVYALFPGSLSEFSPSQISNTPQPWFEAAHNLSSDFVEWNYAEVITTTPQRHNKSFQDRYSGERYRRKF